MVEHAHDFRLNLRGETAVFLCLSVATCSLPMLERAQRLLVVFAYGPELGALSEKPAYRQFAIGPTTDDEVNPDMTLSCDRDRGLAC